MAKPRALPVLEIDDHCNEDVIADDELAALRRANRWVTRKRNKQFQGENHSLILWPRDCLELGLNLTDLVVFTEIVRWFRWTKDARRRPDRPMTRLRVNGRYYVKASPEFLAKQLGNDTRRTGGALSAAAIRWSLKKLEAKGLIELLSGWDARGERKRKIILARPNAPKVDTERYTSKGAK